MAEKEGLRYIFQETMNDNILFKENLKSVTPLFFKDGKPAIVPYGKIGRTPQSFNSGDVSTGDIELDSKLKSLEIATKMTDAALEASDYKNAIGWRDQAITLAKGIPDSIERRNLLKAIYGFFKEYKGAK